MASVHSRRHASFLKGHCAPQPPLSVTVQPPEVWRTRPWGSLFRGRKRILPLHGRRPHDPNQKGCARQVRRVSQRRCLMGLSCEEFQGQTAVHGMREGFAASEKRPPRPFNFEKLLQMAELLQKEESIAEKL